MPRQGTTTERGHGAAHQSFRRAVKRQVELGAAVCPRCGRPILPGEAVGSRRRCLPSLRPTDPARRAVGFRSHRQQHTARISSWTVRASAIWADRWGVRLGQALSRDSVVQSGDLEISPPQRSAPAPDRRPCSGPRPRVASGRRAGSRRRPPTSLWGATDRRRVGGCPVLELQLIAEHHSVLPPLSGGTERHA